MNVDVGMLHRFDPVFASHMRDLLSNSLSIEAVNDIMAEGRYCLAGGAIRSYYDGTKVNDLDIYVLDDNTWNEMSRLAKNFSIKDKIEEDSLITDFNEAEAKPENKYSFGARYGTYKYPYKHIDHISFDNLEPRVEFLRTRYVPDYLARYNNHDLPKIDELTAEDFITASTAAEILEGFDFVCCCAAVEFEMNSGLKSLYDSLNGTQQTLIVNQRRKPLSAKLTLYKQHPLFLTCIVKKDLRLSPVKNMQKCGIAYKRLYKYFSYGYRIIRDHDFKQLERQRKDAFLAGLDLTTSQYDI